MWETFPGGVLLGIFGGVIQLGSSNPDIISDLNLLFPALFSRPGLQNSYPFSDLVSRIHTRFQSFSPKWLKSIPYFRPNRLKNQILWRRTHLYSIYRGALRIPSLRHLPDPKRGKICYRENVGNFAIDADCQA